MKTTNIPQTKGLYSIVSHLLGKMGLCFKSKVNILQYEMELDQAIADSKNSYIEYLEERNLDLKKSNENLIQHIETLTSQQEELKTKIRDLELKVRGFSIEEANKFADFVLSKKRNPDEFKPPIFRFEGNEIRISFVPKEDESLNWGHGTTVLTIDSKTNTFVEIEKSVVGENSWEIEWEQNASGNIQDILEFQ